MKQIIVAAANPSFFCGNHAGGVVSAGLTRAGREAEREIVLLG